MNKRNGISTKVFVLMMALVLVIGATVGGTLAWLTAKTGTVTNTFKATNIEITLAETESKWEKEMVPGVTYTKDPVVTVTENTTVDCYLFVQFDESKDAQKYLNYTSLLTVNEGWTQGDGIDIPDNVWYRVVETDENTKFWHLLAEDKVTVDAEEVTMGTMAEAAAVTLSYIAYAVQYAGFETNAAGAWAKVAS